MMDLLKLKISTRFMKGFVAKVVSKKIYEKLGCKIDIQFRNIEIDSNNGDVTIHIDMDGKVNKTELERVLETFK